MALSYNNGNQYLSDHDFIEFNKRLDVAVAVAVPVTSRIHLSGLNCVEITCKG